MSINRFSDIPPETRPRAFKGSFESLKVNGQSLTPSSFTVGDLDIDYDETKDNNTYVNISTNGNTELYGYLDDPYYQRDDYVPIFGGVVYQVTDLQSFTDAISNAVDGDRIQLMNSITVSFGETFTITASIEIFATDNTIKLISVNGLTAYFLDVFSTDFSMKNIGLAVNSSIGPGIRLNPGVTRSTFSGCDFTCNRAIIVSYADDIYVYDNTFSDLASASPMEYIICFKLKTHTQIKRNTFIGNLAGIKSSASAINLSPALESDFIGELFIEANTFGLEPLGKEMVNTLSVNGQANRLKIYMHNNDIFTNIGVISITNDNLLEGIDTIQITKNRVTNTDDPNHFRGFTYIDAIAAPIIYTGVITTKLRSYNNTFPGITQDMILQYFILLRSTFVEPFITYNINQFFINEYEPLKINPPLIGYISIDTDPDMVGSEVVNPMQENLNANNYNITGINELSLATLRSVSGTNVSVVNDLDLNSSHDITNVRILTANNIEATSVGGDININDNVELLLNNISGVDTLTSHAIKTVSLNATLSQTSINLTVTLLPTGQTVDLGMNDPFKKFGYVYSANGHFGHTQTDSLSGITQDVALNTSLIPDTVNIRDVGSVSNYLARVFTNRVHTNELSGVTSTISLKNSIIPSTANTTDLGSSSLYFADTFTNRVYTNELQAITGGLTFNNSIAPNTDNTKDIGSSSFKWRDIYGSRVRIDTIDGITTPDVTLQGNLLPDLNNSRTLGNASISYSRIATRLLSSDVTIVFRPVNNSNRHFQMSETYFRAITDNVQSLGLSGTKFSVAYITNGVVTGSSREIKKDIIDCKMGLEFINKLEPKMYRYIQDEDDAPMRCGLIYEDLKSVVDESGMSFRGLHQTTEEVEDEEGNGTGEFKEHYAVHYESFISPLIGAVKELKAQNDELLKRIEALEAK